MKNLLRAVSCLLLIGFLGWAFYVKLESVKLERLSVLVIADKQTETSGKSFEPLENDIDDAPSTERESPVDTKFSLPTVILPDQKTVESATADPVVLDRYAAMDKTVFNNDTDPYAHIFFSEPGDPTDAYLPEYYLQEQLDAYLMHDVSVDGLACRRAFCRVSLQSNSDESYYDVVQNFEHIVQWNEDYQIWQLPSSSRGRKFLLYIARQGFSLPDDMSRVSFLDNGEVSNTEY